MYWVCILSTHFSIKTLFYRNHIQVYIFLLIIRLRDDFSSIQLHSFYFSQVAVTISKCSHLLGNMLVAILKTVLYLYLDVCKHSCHHKSTFLSSFIHFIRTFCICPPSVWWYQNKNADTLMLPVLAHKAPLSSSFRIVLYLALCKFQHGPQMSTLSVCKTSCLPTQSICTE